MSQSFFKWDDDFKTGNSTLDAQHFAFVEMVNDLLELSITNKKISLNTIETISNRLSDYVANHFSTEEAMMKKYDVDPRHCEEHIKCHTDFVTEFINQFSDTTRLHDPKKLNDIVEFLIRWLACHILNTDKSLVKQINFIVEDGLTPSEAYEIEDLVIDSPTEPLLKALKVLYLLVSKKNKEIEKQNHELEKNVKLRTTELTEANEKLNQMLYLDLLTGLPNRRFVMEETQKLIFNWERYNVPFSILFVDVDKFKAVNDHYGHENGDKILKWIAEFLKNNIRKTDIACRLGGDEFIVICSHTDAEGAMIIGEKLNDLCSKSSDQKLEFWVPSLSIGVSTVTDLLRTPSELLKLADDAMYTSKLKGGGTTSFMSEEIL